MDIRKIIKEEIDDFDWAKEIPSFTPTLDYSTIKKGDRVYIHHESRFWYDIDDREQKWWSHDVDNPLNVLGSVDDFSSTSVDVLWDNGNYTSYAYNDLKQEKPSHD